MPLDPKDFPTTHALARETKLRGVMREVADRLDDLRVGDIGRRTVGEVSAALRLQLTEALAGTGPDYVRADLLAAEQAKVKQLSAAMDVLDSHETMTADIVAQYLEEAGLKKPAPDLDVVAAFALAAHDIDDRAKYTGGEFSQGLRAAATLLRERVKFIPPKPPKTYAYNQRVLQTSDVVDITSEHMLVRPVRK